jgi:hypothetical protein
VRTARRASSSKCGSSASPAARLRRPEEVHVGGVEAARRAALQRDPHVRGRERRRVVEAVADEHGADAAEGLDAPHLVGGQELRFDRDPEMLAEPRRGARRVAGQHTRLEPAARELRDDGGRLGPQPRREPEPRDARSIALEEHRRRFVVALGGRAPQGAERAVDAALDADAAQHAEVLGRARGPAEARDRGAAQRAADRVFAVQFERAGELEGAIDVVAARRLDAEQLDLAVGQRARLVEQHAANAREPLQHVRALDEHAAPPGRAERRPERQRRRDAERAGARDQEHRQRDHEPALGAARDPVREARGYCEHDRERQQHTRRAVGDAELAPAALHGAAQEPLDLRARTRFADGFGAHQQRPVERRRARQDAVAGPERARLGLARQRRRVDERAALQHEAVDGDGLARPHVHTVADDDGLGVDDALVARDGVLQRDRPDVFLGEAAQVLAGALLGACVEPPPEPDEHQHHRRGLEVDLAVADEGLPGRQHERGARARDDERVRREPTARAHDALGERQADEVQDRQRERERRDAVDAAQRLGARAVELARVAARQEVGVERERRHHDAHREERADEDAPQQAVGAALLEAAAEVPRERAEPSHHAKRARASARPRSTPTMVPVSQ